MSIPINVTASEAFWLGQFCNPTYVLADAALHKDAIVSFLHYIGLDMRPVPPRSHGNNALEAKHGSFAVYLCGSNLQIHPPLLLFSRTKPSESPMISMPLTLFLPFKWLKATLALYPRALYLLPLLMTHSTRTIRLSRSVALRQLYAPRTLHITCLKSETWSTSL